MRVSYYYVYCVPTTDKKIRIINYFVIPGSLNLRQGGGSGDDSVTAVATGDDGSIFLALDVETSSATSSGLSSNSSTTAEAASAAFQFEVMKLTGDGSELWQWKVSVFNRHILFRTHHGQCCARASSPGEEGRNGAMRVYLVTGNAEDPGGHAATSVGNPSHNDQAGLLSECIDPTRRRVSVVRNNITDKPCQLLLEAEKARAQNPRSRF